MAAYGRSLYALVCGLFTARWVLMTLGEVDYGLIGVVGGLVGFMSFFNGLMAASVARFYAFSVGRAQAAEDADAALEDCRRWFNAAVAIHTVVPVASLLIGYPIGEWAVRSYLTVPPERLEACVWVFRITCLSCFVSMATVPYQAMYTAKQEIAELTIYDFIKTTLNVIFLCYMVSHPADWFVRYVGWTAFLGIAPSLVISGRAFLKYRECRFVWRYLIEVSRIKEVSAYAGYRFVVSLAIASSYQGIVILVNKMLGPARNAAMSVSNSVSSHVLGLMNSFITAMSPAITNAMGAGDLKRVESLACRASACSSLAVAVFAIPLCLEVDEVFHLWLKNPPAQAGTLCVLMLIASFLDQLVIGQCISVLALKNIARFQLYGALAFSLPFPIAWAVFKCGGGLEGVGIGFIVLYIVADIVKVRFAKAMCGQSVRRWVSSVLLPVCLIVFASTTSGLCARHLLESSLLRIMATTFAVEIVFIPLVWTVVLTVEERGKIIGKIKDVLVWKRH